MAKLLIRQIASKDTLHLRGAIMRPGEPPENLVYEADNDPDTLHLGAYVDDKQVGIASIYHEDPPDFSFLPDDMPRIGLWRLRNVATVPEVRGKGYGGKLLQAALGYVAAQGGSALWCNARLNAVWFYERYGFKRHSNVHGTQNHLRYFMWRAINVNRDALKTRLIDSTTRDQHLSSDLQQVVGALIQANFKLRERLIEAGYDAKDVEDWTFHTWEVLAGWRNLLLQFTAITNLEDSARIPQALNDWSTDALYSAGSHVEYHMRTMQDELKPYLARPDETGETDTTAT